MVVVAVVLLVVAVGLNVVFAQRVSRLNEGRRIPLTSYPIKPPFRVMTLQAVGAGCAVFGALILGLEFPARGTVLGPGLTGFIVALVMVGPALISRAMHNRRLRSEAP